MGGVLTSLFNQQAKIQELVLQRGKLSHNKVASIWCKCPLVGFQSSSLMMHLGKQQERIKHVGPATHVVDQTRPGEDPWL